MERAECNRNCWISAAIAGVVVLLFTSGLGELHWLAGLFLGCVTFMLSGPLMVWLLCHERPALFSVVDGMTATDWQRAMPDRQPEALLVGGSLGPEPMSVAQMPIVAGAMPAPPADDLERIKGIGPKISGWLNGQGVTSYGQIAAWDAATVADFAQRLGRLGNRIEADDWVGQAELLAAGGETAHSRHIDKGGDK